MLTKLKENLPLAKLKQYPSCNVIVIMLAIIMLWRGVWGVLDVYLFPEMPILSYLISIALGILILYLNEFNLNNLKK